MSIGQKLQIPETDFSVNTKPNYISYTVVKGDTLYSLSKKYGVSVNTLIVDNSLKNNTLSIGQVLFIRVPYEEEGILECYGEDYNPPTNDITYIVKKGDSLWSIANKYNTSVDNIKKKNNLTSNNLSIGMTLKIWGVYERI